MIEFIMQGDHEMTREEIIRKLNFFQQSRDHISAEIYFLLKKSEMTEIVMVDLQAETQQEICNSFFSSFEELFNDEDKSVMNLSLADNRNNTIYEYDLQEYPPLLTIIKQPIPASARMFNFTTDNFSLLLYPLIRKLLFKWFRFY